MHFILGAIVISLAVFAFCFTLLGARNPHRPWWASDAWIANVHCLAIIGLGLTGVLSIGTGLLGFEANGFNSVSLLIALAILGVTIIGVKALRLQKRLADYQRGPLEVLPAIGAGPEGDGHTPRTPRKAA